MKRLNLRSVRFWVVPGLLALVVGLPIVAAAQLDPGQAWPPEELPPASPRKFYLLLHGIDRTSGDWALVRQRLIELGADPNKIFTPNLPNRLHLHAWAEQIISYLENIPAQNEQIDVVGHCFAGTALVYILRVTREFLAFGNFGEFYHQVRSYIEGRSWPVQLMPACLDIVNGLEGLRVDLGLRQRWLNAALKTDNVFLYMSPLRGAICSSHLSHTHPSYASIEVLGRGLARVLWYPVRYICWTWVGWHAYKDVFNLFGFGRGEECRDLVPRCGPILPYVWGAHNGRLQDDHQRLFDRPDGDRDKAEEIRFKEQFVGLVCHFDFTGRRGAINRLLRIVLDPFNLHRPGIRDPS